MPSNQPSSNARVFFDHIKSQANAFEYLLSLPYPQRTEPFFEEEWIDFKGNPRDVNDAKKIWSKALSAYANITDGLIIWGIDARKMPPRDIDAACGVNLIPDAYSFESKLRDWVRDATNPPIVGTEFQTYVDSDDKGFVICFVPNSSQKPHRAEFANRHYYYRANDDFFVAEPGLLRTLFHPQVKPRLEIITRLECIIYNHFSIPFHTQFKLACEGTIENTGHATAKNIHIGMNWNGETQLMRETGAGRFYPNAPWTMVNNSKYQYAVTLQGDIHPGFSSKFYSILEWSVERRINMIDDKRGKYAPCFKPFFIEYFIFSENFEPQKTKVEFADNDLFTVFDKDDRYVEKIGVMENLK